MGVNFEFTEKPGGLELEKKQEIATEWGFLEESKKVNSADQIDQFNALRFKTQMGSKNYQVGRARKFRKSKCLV